MGKVLDKIKWKLFGETKILFWFIGIISFVSMSVIGILIWIAIHFIIKCW